MTDYFALLNEPRRPWLDADLLKAKFLSRSGQMHPDRHHADSPAARDDASKNFADLNAAFNCLRDPKERLRHLLALELGTKPKDLHEMPKDLVELFMQVGQLNRQVGSFLSDRTKAHSPILQVSFFEKGQEWVEKLTALQKNIAAHNEAVVNRVRELDDRWLSSTDHAALLPELEQCWRLLSFYSRWNSQLQNAIVQLSL